jgi:hypothetical protein
MYIGLVGASLIGITLVSSHRIVSDAVKKEDWYTTFKSEMTMSSDLETAGRRWSRPFITHSADDTGKVGELTFDPSEFARDFKSLVLNNYFIKCSGCCFFAIHISL